MVALLKKIWNCCGKFKKLELPLGNLYHRKDKIGGIQLAMDEPWWKNI
jgi:hypothetical protein